MIEKSPSSINWHTTYVYNINCTKCSKIYSRDTNWVLFQLFTFMDVDYTCKLNCTVLLKMNELASLWRLQLFKINKKNISVIQLHYYNINLLFTFLVFWDLALKKKEIQVLNKTEKRFLPLAEQHVSASCLLMLEHTNYAMVWQPHTTWLSDPTCCRNSHQLFVLLQIKMQRKQIKQLIYGQRESHNQNTYGQILAANFNVFTSELWGREICHLLILPRGGKSFAVKSCCY